MKEKTFWFGCLFLAMIGCCGCDGSDASYEDVTNECNPACEVDETCLNGECKPNETQGKDGCNPACEADEICVNGECKPNETQGEEECNPACNEGEICEKGVCNQDETLLICDPACKDGFDCIDGECFVHTKTDDTSGEIVIDSDDTEEGDIDEPIDNDEDVIVEDAAMVLSKETITTIQGKDNDVFSVSLSRKPVSNVTIPIVSSNEKAGKVSMNKVVFTPDDWDKAQDIEVTGASVALSDKKTVYEIVVGPPQSEDAAFKALSAVKIKATHLNDSTPAPKDIVPTKITLSKKSIDILLKGKAETITANFDKADVTDPAVAWTVENLTDKVRWSKLISLEVDAEKRTAKVKSVVDMARKETIDNKYDLARTLRITAVHSSGVKASATIELKPYLPHGLTLTQISKVRDFDVRGHKNDEYNEDKNSLGDLTCGYYDEHTSNVFTKDMNDKYVEPYVIKYGGAKYGTRASVLGAARFLVTQFPKDVPYASGLMFDNEEVPATVGRYTWISNDYIKDRDQVRVFGLNLTKKGYNSFSSFEENNVILGNPGQDSVTPWGCLITTSKGTPVKKGNKEIKNAYNGLRCTGLVGWVMNNGRFYLGDWQSNIFAKSVCRDANGKRLRNYQCSELVNDEKYNGQFYHWSNPNGRHLALFGKLNQLKESDFVPTEKLTTKSDIKAGDLLWYGNYDCPLTSDGQCPSSPENCENGKGHAAFILGISRNSDKTIKYIYIAQADKRNGTQLTALSIDKVKSSKRWKIVRTAGSSMCSYHDARWIKMDNVYNYYYNKKKSDPEFLKLLNGKDFSTYGYTELWF